MSFAQDDLIELQTMLNGRATSNFLQSTHNVRALLTKGTQGKVLAVKKMPSGNFGIEITVTNEGPNKGKNYWVYYNPKQSNLKLIAKNQTPNIPTPPLLKPDSYKKEDPKNKDNTVDNSSADSKKEKEKEKEKVKDTETKDPNKADKVQVNKDTPAIKDEDIALGNVLDSLGDINGGKINKTLDPLKPDCNNLPAPPAPPTPPPVPPTLPSPEKKEQPDLSSQKILNPPGPFDGSESIVPPNEIDDSSTHESVCNSKDEITYCRKMVDTGDHLRDVTNPTGILESFNLTNDGKNQNSLKDKNKCPKLPALILPPPP